MAVTRNSFSAAVDAWCRKSETRMEAVLRESSQRLINAAQEPVAHGGNMPVDTGYLRSSGVASTDGPTLMRADSRPQKDENGEKRTYTFSVGQTVSVLATLKVGMTLWFCWTAIYARVVEFGGTNRPARGFVRLAAQRWKAIVSEVAREARQRAGG